MLWKGNLFMQEKWFSEYVEQVNANRLDQAIQVLLDNVRKDQMIYKYCRGLSRDLRNLQDHMHWLSSAYTFNDPYDCFVTVDCDLKTDFPDPQEKGAITKYLRELEEYKRAEQLRSSFFVTCFSENNDSFPLWAYYGENHKGICLGYNLYDLIMKYKCMPVIYSKEFPVYREEDVNRSWINALRKSDEWMHEKEWRIVIRDDKHVGEAGILRAFPNPEEIYMGYKREKLEKDISEQYADTEELMEFAEKNDVHLYIPVISKKEYKLIDKALILNK